MHGWLQRRGLTDLPDSSNRACTLAAIKACANYRGAAATALTLHSKVAPRGVALQQTAQSTTLHNNEERRNKAADAEYHSPSAQNAARRLLRRLQTLPLHECAAHKKI